MAVLIITKAAILLAFFYFLPLPYYETLAILITVAVFDCLAFYLISYKRRAELERIKSVIRSIRHRELNLSEEINLGKDLYELQEEIKKMYMQAKQDIEYLKKLEKVRTQFLGNVSHELRTPIFAIQGYLETLVDGAIDNPNVNRSFLLKEVYHVESLNNLLNDLIDISMIESGEMNLSFRYFRLSELLDDLLQEIKYHADEKGLEFIIHPVDKELQVFGDRNKIKQLLINLIQNAIKYTETGRVEVTAEKEDNSAKIAVKDTGIGISEKDLPRIFERFYRVDKERSRQAGGTGLGLAIVKHIAEAHNSKIEVKSEPGKGSEFSFKLKI
ncbi:MAG: sensor histidine kinase [Bacillota bacterium]